MDKICFSYHNTWAGNVHEPECLHIHILFLLAWKAYFFVLWLLLSCSLWQHIKSSLQMKSRVFWGLQTLGVTQLHLPGQSPQAASSSPSSASYILWGSEGHLFKHRTFMSSHRLFPYLGALGTIDLTHELPLMAWLKSPFCYPDVLGSLGEGKADGSPRPWGPTFHCIFTSPSGKDYSFVNPLLWRK